MTPWIIAALAVAHWLLAEWVSRSRKACMDAQQDLIESLEEGRRLDAELILLYQERLGVGPWGDPG